MTEHTSDDVEREEIEMLLPWYVAGNLAPSDRARVESYLARHPEMRFQLDLIRGEQEQSILANEALGAPSAQARHRLMASLPAQRPSFAQWIAASTAWQKITDFFAAPTARGVQWGAIAAAALILVQAAAISTLLVRDEGGAYQTASGPSGNVGVSALVVFAEDATAGAVARLLADFNATIVDGPKPGGVYKVRLQTGGGSQDPILRLSERRDIVKSAIPTKD